MSQQLLDVLKEQRRQRRLRFWLGFLAILLVGGLWAQLSKDPIGPAFGNDFIVEAEQDVFFEEAPAVEVFEPTTTVTSVEGRSDHNGDRTMRLVLTTPTAKVTGPLRLTAQKVLALITLVAMTTMVLLVAGGPAAGANTDSDQFASVKVETLETVPWEAGLIVASQVTVTTERAISGVLTVVSTAEGQSTTTYEFDIDIGADTTVTLPVDLFTGWNGVEATATLTSNGDVIAGDELRAFGQGNGNSERVAFYGHDFAPARIPLIGSEEQVRTFVLGDRLDGLERSSSLISTPAAITGLGADSDESMRVEAWIRGGGQLVIDGPRNALADDFHRYPTANEDRYLLGAGSILYLSDWEDGIPIGGYLGRSGLRELVDSQDLGSGAAGELAILAGISLPSARTVALILLAYSVIAGPVAYTVLASRGMQRKMWSVLPALSALFVVGILGFGFASRTGRSDTHITIVEVNEQASRATSNLLLTSSVGGGRGIETPAGWTYLGQGRTEAQRPVKIRPGASSTEISHRNPTGQQFAGQGQRRCHPVRQHVDHRQHQLRGRQNLGRGNKQRRGKPDPRAGHPR